MPNRGLGAALSGVTFALLIWFTTPSILAQEQNELVPRHGPHIPLTTLGSEYERLEIQGLLERRIDQGFESIFNRCYPYLQSPNPSFRGHAALRLGRLCAAADYSLNDPAVFDKIAGALARSLADPELIVRQGAASGLAAGLQRKQIPLHVVAEPLRKALQDEDAIVRAEAARAIGVGGIFTALPDVVKLADDPDPKVREEAARCLGRLAETLWGLHRVRDSLVDGEAQERPTPGSYQMRLAKYKEIVAGMAPSAVAALMKLADDSESSVREVAIESLGCEWRDAIGPAAETLKAALKDEDAFVREQAARSIRVLGKDAAPLLLEAIEVEGSWSAISSLGEIFQTTGPIHGHHGMQARQRVYRGSEKEWINDYDRYWHFSPPGKHDLPQQPDELTQKAARILALLLADPENDFSTRTDAAEALDKMGATASSARGIVVKALTAEEPYVQEKAIGVLQSMGAAAEDQIPAIAALIHQRQTDHEVGESDGHHDRNDGKFHVDNVTYAAVSALDTIASEIDHPEVVIPALTEALGSRAVGAGQRAAVALARRGEKAIPSLVEALNSSNAGRRRSAAYALAYLREEARPAVPRLVELLEDDDADVVWNAAQTLAEVGDNSEGVLLALIATLDHPDDEVVAKAADALAELRCEHSSRAIVPLANVATGDSAIATRSAAVRALARIGLERNVATRLAQLRGLDSTLARDVLEALLKSPDQAAVFLTNQPPLQDCPVSLLIKAVKRADDESQSMRDAILASDQLPSEFMAWVGDPRYVPILQERMREASPYHKTHLQACARACGLAPERVVDITEGSADDYRPASAKGGDPRRAPPGFFGGHGDGYTRICATGKILMPDGKPAANVRFLDPDDHTVLDTQPNDLVTFRHDARTGRFVFFTDVYAFFAVGEGKPEQTGPYGTGSIKVTITAEGVKPLEVTFYDEMPEMRITLTASDDAPTSRRHPTTAHQ